MRQSSLLTIVLQLAPDLIFGKFGVNFRYEHKIIGRDFRDELLLISNKIMFYNFNKHDDELTEILLKIWFSFFFFGFEEGD